MVGMQISLIREPVDAAFRRLYLIGCYLPGGKLVAVAGYLSLRPSGYTSYSDYP